MCKVKTTDCVACVQSYISEGCDCTVFENRTQADFIFCDATLNVSERIPAAKNTNCFNLVKTTFNCPNLGDHSIQYTRKI